MENIIQCSQCIQVKPLPATNTQPARLKASCNAKTITMSLDQAQQLSITKGIDADSTYHHSFAPVAIALQLADSLDWGWSIDTITIGAHGESYYITHIQ